MSPSNIMSLLIFSFSNVGGVLENGGLIWSDLKWETETGRSHFICWDHHWLWLDEDWNKWCGLIQHNLILSAVVTTTTNCTVSVTVSVGFIEVCWDTAGCVITISNAGSFISGFEISEIIGWVIKTTTLLCFVTWIQVTISSSKITVNVSWWGLWHALNSGEEESENRSWGFHYIL